MSEFNPNPFKDEAPDAVARFVLALVASLALHLALAFGVRIKAVQPVGRVPVTMEVRIERAPQTRIKAPPLTVNAADATGKKPEEPKPDEIKPAPQSPEPTESAPAILPTLDIPLLEDPTWYSAKQVDVHPTALYPIQPDYPGKAAEQGVGGSVVLLLLIDEAGVVKEVSVEEANPEGVFEESALAAFRNARFAPAQKNGRAVKSRMLIRVDYELNAPKKPTLIQPPLPLVP